MTIAGALAGRCLHLREPHQARKKQMIAYRPATPSDAEAVARLHAQSWRENYRSAFLDAGNQLVRVAVDGTMVLVPAGAVRGAARCRSVHPDASQPREVPSLRGVGPFF
jgi:hypothetical protein